MRWNPFLNAIGAAAYIWCISLFFQYIERVMGNTPDTFLAPIGMLSLLVFSVALMGFLFFYRPVVLLIENKKNEAISYFLKTLGSFGVIAAIIIVALLVLP